MTETLGTEIIINATQLGHASGYELYEFTLDLDMHVTECGHVESISEGIIVGVIDFEDTLKNDLFELNHVRVNPRLDNSIIIHHLSEALAQSGVSILQAPSHDHMALCFRPLGELSETVRFYIRDDGTPVFLSTAVQLSLVR